MLEAVEGIRYVLEVVLEVLEVLEPGMVRCVPLCMLEAVESVLCLLKVPEVILYAIDRRAHMLCAGAAGEHAMCCGCPVLEVVFYVLQVLEPGGAALCAALHAVSA